MLKTLLKSVREYKKATLITPVYVAAEVIMECLIPFVMASLIDEMTADSMRPVLKYGGILVAMALCSLYFGVASARQSCVAACGYAKNLRKDLFYKVQSLSFGDIDYFSSSSLVTRLTTDVTNIQNAFQMIIRISVRTPLGLIFAVVMSLSIHPGLSLVFIAILPILGLALGLIMAKSVPVFKRIFTRYDAMNNSVQENIAGVRVVKSFVREDFEKQKFGGTSAQVCKDFTFVEKLLALNNPVMMFCIYAAMTIVSYLSARIIIVSGATELTTGQMSSLINYGVQILSSMMMLSMAFVMVSMATESARRTAEVLEYTPTLTGTENTQLVPADGTVDFSHVSFRYGTNGRKNVLEDIDLHISSGMTVGILGGTGSSKTSLIQLIPRLYDATEGVVSVGGRDVRDYDLTTLRDSVAVVLQKNTLFSGTIRENLRWGNAEAPDEELERVCRIAQAEEFVSQLPDGLDTHIEQGGANVSGGQKQRLCIARALLKKPKILILDDSTSAVDTKTDALIRRGMKDELPETTKIIIAQRVSSVEDADLILVMDGGRIAERGTHEELMAKNGIYREVYDSQTRGKEAV